MSSCLFLCRNYIQTPVADLKDHLHVHVVQCELVSRCHFAFAQGIKYSKHTMGGRHRQGTKAYLILETLVEIIMLRKE